MPKEYEQFPMIPAGPNMNPDDIGKVPQSTNVPGYNAPVMPGQDKLLDLQVYQPLKKPGGLMGKQANIPLEPVALSSPFIPPQFSTYLSNFMKNFYTPFIYKDYHINIGGPAEDRLRASLVYEDALPSPEIFTSYKTLRERNNLVDYVRSNFINASEGEFVDFSGGKSGLNTRLKLLELAPFGTNPFSSNPYANSPKDLLIYKSCYPIMVDKKYHTTKCQKNSVGMLIRIYKLTTDEYYSKFPQYKPQEIKNGGLEVSIGMNDNPDRYDVWRDEKYYEYIRNNINKSYISPNFLQSYCFFLWTAAGFNYGKNGKLDPSDKNLKSVSDAGVHLILLCESPTMNLITWTTNIFSTDRNTRTQIYSGYKTPASWETIIFQMLSVFYLMEKQVFTFSDMSVTNNFFVKDVSIYGDSGNQFWLYRINGLEYYVPCRSDLLVVDHDYHDLTSGDKKIIGAIYGDKEDEVRERVRLNAIKCISSNSFEVQDNTIATIPDETRKLFENINKNLTERETVEGIDKYKYTLEEVIELNFAKFLHNRIGTMIRDNEKPYIKKNDIRPFSKGELVVYESKYDTFEIVMYLENLDEYKCKCITNNKVDTNKITSSIVELNKDMIYHYAESEIIKQDVLPGQPAISLDYLIETYTL